MSDFYTGMGDDGTSGLLGEGRIEKDHPRIEAIGVVDEVNASLGIVRSNFDQPSIQKLIITIQRDLYHMMAELAATPENADQFRGIDDLRVQWLQDTIENLGNKVEIPKEFILPGDTKVGALIDCARTIVRRAERRVSGLYNNGDLENRHILRYLNRLSTLCFILEIWELHISNTNLISLAKDK